jgi:S-adenosylmethionine synthetase
VLEEKSIRVARFQEETVKSAMELMASAGLSHPDDVTRDVVSTRVERNVVETFAQTFPELEKGCLLNENSVPKSYLYFWKKATTESF